GVIYQISYVGGIDANDVTLTVQAAATVYVDDNWAGTTAGDDPDGLGAATSFGYDAFGNINDALAAVADGGTIYIYDGDYAETLDISKNVSLLADIVGGVDIDAGGASTGIAVNSGFDVVISGIDLANFSFTGILLEGSLELTDSTVSGGLTGIDVDGGTL